MTIYFFFSHLKKRLGLPGVPKKTTLDSRAFDNKKKLKCREGSVVGQIEGKNLRYHGTIPFCLHIVP
jgi:hypothetical protein